MKRMREYRCEYFFADGKTIQERVNTILTQIKEKEMIRLVFFGETTNEKYEEELSAIVALVQTHYGEDYPLVSYIAQPVLGDYPFSAEAHYTDASDRGVKPHFKMFEDVRYVVFESTRDKCVMTGGVRGGSLLASVRDQSDEIFRKVEAILRLEEMEIHHITRQWNYIGDITGFEGDVQNYQAFNDSRSLFYNRTEWLATGYPAATGIGMGCAGVIVDLIATKPSSANVEIKAIDNPMQIAAHSYSQEVLLGKEDERLTHRSTPKFERAKTVCSDKGYTCFISGTAAIRGEESLENTNIHRQTVLTIENINHLISQTNHARYGAKLLKEESLSCARIYVKNREDYASIGEVLRKYWEHTPALYVIADVCRDELLVEIEGVASILY